MTTKPTSRWTYWKTLTRRFFGVIYPSSADLLLALTRVGESIGVRLTTIERSIQEVLTTMPSKEELSAALSQVLTEVGKIGEDLSARLTTLEAEVATGNDVTAQFAQVQDIATKLQQIDDMIPERVTPQPAEGGTPPPAEGVTTPPADVSNQ